MDHGHCLASYDTSLVVSGGVDCQKRRQNVYDKKPQPSLRAVKCAVLLSSKGVTLRLLVINISSSSPAINTATYYQRCVVTCETVAVVHRRPCLQHLACCSVNTGSQARYGLRIAISAYPICIQHPVRGVPVGILLCRLARKN